MEDSMLPLKRVELSLTNFNEVAIPHHLNLLRQHKANIIKYEASGEWARVRSEQTHARRVTSQLRALLAEMEALRARVRPAHRAAFDRATARARDLTLRAIVDYLETSPLSMNRAGGAEAEAAGSVASGESVGAVPPPELLLLQLEEQETALQQREAALAGWCELQREVHALHAVWRALHAAAGSQAADVAAVDSNTARAADNVQAARVRLSRAEAVAAGAWGLGGAAAGALAAGPVGLLVGAKAGAAAMAAGSAAGWWLARLLGARRGSQLTHQQDGAQDDKQDATQEDPGKEKTQ